jgi:hypothetical protein
MRNGVRYLFSALLLAWPCLGLVPAAQAGTVILEGSDAIGFHCAEGQSGGCAYRDQVWSAIGGADPRPIAVFGNTVTGSPVTSLTHPVADFATVAAAGPLSNYVAAYFLATDGCCTENDSLITASGAQTAVAAYLAAGGTVMIENYIGGSAWDFAVGTSGGNGLANTAGFGATLGGPGCSDGETVTATGTANGFTQPPAIDCWTHQAYNEPFFNTLGFTKSFFDSDPAFAADNPGFGPFSSLLSDGNTVTGGGGGVPEPTTITLFGMGLLGLSLALRRRSAVHRRAV